MTRKISDETLATILKRHAMHIRGLPGGEPADLRGANLSGADLIEVNLCGANLSGADLTRTNLSWAHLIEADLSNAYLSGANLAWANLRQANLCCADLTEAKLFDANLSKVNLHGADLHKANLIGANLTGANLNGVHLLETVGNMQEIKSAQFDSWPLVWITDPDGRVTLAIGCQTHPLEMWVKSDPCWIAALDNGATEWWARYRDIVLALVEAAPAKPWGAAEGGG